MLLNGSCTLHSHFMMSLKLFFFFELIEVRHLGQPIWRNKLLVVSKFDTCTFIYFDF